MSKVDKLIIHNRDGSTTEVIPLKQWDPSEEPIRIVRQRGKGWKMPANAVYVGRPTKWGNPWTVEAALASGLFKPEFVHQVCVNEYRAWLEGIKSPNSEHLGAWKVLEERREIILSSLEELRGKDLACWCLLNEPCHADVLLELANREVKP